MDCTIKKWDVLSYALHHEPEKEAVFTDLVDGLNHVFQTILPS